MPRAKLTDAQPVSQPQGGRANLSDVSGTEQGSSPNYSPDTSVVNPTMGEMGTGVLREGANLLSGGHNIGRQALDLIPGVKGSEFGQDMDTHQAMLDELARPRNTGEAMGKFGGEMASYLLPAKAESMVGEAAEHLPSLLRPVARIGTAAASNAGMSAMNRESPETGAAVGAGAGLLGEGGRLLANPLMRSAIPGKIGKDTAGALLNETTGIRPSTVLGHVEDKIGEAGRNLDTAVHAPGVQPVSIDPAMAPVNQLKLTAGKLGVPELDTQANNLIDWLRQNAVTGQHYGPSVDPETALAMRRGGNEMFGGNRIWKDVASPRAQGTFKQSYGALTDALHEAAPGTVESDEMIHNLMPARTGLRTLVRDDPSVAGNVMGRVGARTGALASMLTGAAAGADKGPLGMLIGGGTGLIAPEIASAPAAKMAMARALYSPMTPLLGRAAATPAMDRLVETLRQRDRGAQGQ